MDFWYITIALYSNSFQQTEVTYCPQEWLHEIAGPAGSTEPLQNKQGESERAAEVPYHPARSGRGSLFQHGTH